MNMKGGAAAFAVTGVLLGAIAAQASPPAAAVDCTGGVGGNQPLAKVPEFIVKTISPSAAGPGSADIADLCGVTAAEFQPANSMIGDDRYTALTAFAGVAESGDGAAFVDAFLSGLGADARNGTVEMDGRTVQAFWTSAGDGLAYAVGPTVVIGYVVPSNTIAGGLDPAATQEPAKGAFTKIMARMDGKPLSDSYFPGTGLGSYPLARGRYTTPGDPGWLYFRTDDFKGAIPEHCGIAPEGALAGCDVVSSLADAPAGTNQIVVDGSAPARYIHSDTATFTRDIDELVPGHRLQNGAALCSRGYQGTVHCEIGEHSFSTNFAHATLE